MTRRAQQQADTRRRIVEAAVELHASIGPAQTTFSQIAERAGVQRHTFYAHFPDERSLLMACSGLAFERQPFPDADTFRDIDDLAERRRAGLRAIYDWYARNAALLSCVLRDTEHHALTREIVELRFGPPLAAFREVLGAQLNARQRALLELALSFYTWRTLTRDAGLKQAAAVSAMAESLATAACGRSD